MLATLPPHELLDTRTEYCFVVVSASARSGYLRSWNSNLGGRSILIKGRSTRDSTHSWSSLSGVFLRKEKRCLATCVCVCVCVGVLTIDLSFSTAM